MNLHFTHLLGIIYTSLTGQTLNVSSTKTLKENERDPHLRTFPHLQEKNKNHKTVQKQGLKEHLQRQQKYVVCYALMQCSSSTYANGTQSTNQC